MRSRNLRILTLLVAGPLAGTGLAAQGVTAQLSGQVSSAAGGALAGAVVTIRNQETGYTRTLQTDASGRFVAASLPVGPYVVTVAKEGFQTATTPRQNLNLGDAAPISLKLAPVNAATVEIVASVAQVDTERASAAAFVSPESLQTLPTNGRRWENFALLTPQVTVSSRGDLAIGGQRGVNTTINVDGGNYNSSFFGGTLGSEAGGTPFTLSSEAIREFQVVTDGASAEFGRMGGGYLNAITKSGTNEFSGSVFVFERPRSLMAKRHQDGREASEFTNRQYGFTVGGPILKDKLFYFVAVDLQRDTRPNPVVFAASASGPSVLNPANPADAAMLAHGGDYTTKNDQTAVFGRLDWQASVDHAIQFRVNRSSFKGDNGAGFNVAYDATSREEGTTLSLVGQWTWIIGGSMLNEFKLNHVREDLPRTRRSDIPQVDVRNVGRYGEALFTREFEMKQLQIADTFTFMTTDWQIRAGFDATFHDIFETFTPRSGGVYSFTSLANFQAGNWADYQQFFSLQPGVSVKDAGTMDEKEKEYAAFVQADWRPTPQWKLGLGVRWDRQEHPDFGIADFTGNPAGYARPGALTAKIPTDTSISPRLSFTWTPAADGGRSVVRGSAGLYVSRTPSVFNYQVLTSNGQRAALIRFTSVPGAVAALYPSFVRGASFNYTNPYQLPEDAVSANPAAFTVTPPDIQTFDPEFKNPRTKRYNLGYERAMGRGLTLGVSATVSATENLERITDLNLVYTAPNAQGRPVFNAVRPNANYRSMQVYKSDARSRYQALTFSGKYAPEGSWIEASLYYTYAKERDNDSNERSFSGYTTQDPFNLEGDYGWSNNDRRNVVTGYVNIHERWFSGVRFGFNLRYLSGLPYNPTFSNDLNADGARNERILGTERNSFREVGRYIVDLKVSRDWRFAKKMKFEVSGEVFNLFNKTTRYTRTTGFGGTDAAPTATTALWNISTERQVQLGARFSF